MKQMCIVFNTCIKEIIPAFCPTEKDFYMYDKQNHINLNYDNIQPNQFIQTL